MNTTWELHGLRLSIDGLWKLKNSPALPAAFEKEMHQAHTAFKKRVDSEEVGFYDWPEKADTSLVKEVEELAASIRSRCQAALLIGIGGSYLGPAALASALGKSPLPFPVFWLSNTDGKSIEEAEAFCKATRPAAVVISKSGNTVETLSGFYHLSALVSEVIAITDPEKGELRRLSRLQGWKTLPVPPNIGGRFSVLTSVGLLPLALQGYDISQILKGAREARKAFEGFSPEKNPVYLYAYSKFLWNTQKEKAVDVLMPYHSGLKLLSDWYVQLWAESLGKIRKNGERVGMTVLPALGTSDQHSMLQLFKEGPRDKIIGFIDIEKTRAPKIGKPGFSSPDFDYLHSVDFDKLNRAALSATRESLMNSEVPTLTFTFSEISPSILGSWIFFMETACAFSGELYQVNAFDQPGVEEAKVLLRKNLK